MSTFTMFCEKNSETCVSAVKNWKPYYQGYNEGERGSTIPGHRIIVGLPNHCRGRRTVPTMSQVLSVILYNELLPKHFRFKHQQYEVAKLATCPGHHDLTYDYAPAYHNNVSTNSTYLFNLSIFHFGSVYFTADFLAATDQLELLCHQSDAIRMKEKVSLSWNQCAAHSVVVMLHV